MPAARNARSMRVPSDMAVTARSLAGLAGRFTTAELTTLVDLLIGQLDSRDLDADLEPDWDCETDAELGTI